MVEWSPVLQYPWPPASAHPRGLTALITLVLLRQIQIGRSEVVLGSNVARLGVWVLGHLLDRSGRVQRDVAVSLR